MQNSELRPLSSLSRRSGRCAQERGEIEVVYLVNMLSEDGKYSRSHGIDSRLLELQSEIIGIPIVQKETTWEDYEDKFKKLIYDLKNKGVEAGIFGDIYLQEHKDWVERVCAEVGIKPIQPLWKIDTEHLINEFIHYGFKAIVVATRADIMDKEWLGKKIDNKFVSELKTTGGIDLCGEKGEYHTFVFDGPIFKKPVEFITGKKVLKEKYWFLEIRLKS